MYRGENGRQASIPAVASAARTAIASVSLPQQHSPRETSPVRVATESGSNSPNGKELRPQGGAGKGKGSRSHGQSTPVMIGAATKKGKQASVQSKGNSRVGQKQTAVRYQYQTRGQAGRTEGLSSIARTGVGLAGILVIGLAVFAFLIFTSPNGSPSGAGGQTGGRVSSAQVQAEQQAQVVPVGVDGKQTANIVLNSATFQYEPKSVKVKAGVPVHFNLSVINGDPG